MPHAPQTYAPWRCPRAQLADVIPAVLRSPDGSGSRGILNIVSLTGGLLSISSTLDRGSRINLMFVTPEGPVRGTVEMLRAVSVNQQPFRFVALEECAQRRLRSIIGSHIAPGVDQPWVKKYRTAMVPATPPWRGRHCAAVLAAIALALAGVGTAICLTPIHFWR